LSERATWRTRLPAKAADARLVAAARVERQSVIVESQDDRVGARFGRTTDLQRASGRARQADHAARGIQAGDADLP
jgi:hypothetical protein